MIKIDSHSLEGGRRRYVAICTLVYDKKVLPKTACIGGVIQNLLFVEGPWSCSHCNRVGHSNKSCLVQLRERPSEENQTGNGSGDSDWILLPRERGRKKDIKDHDGPTNYTVGQRRVRWTPKKGEKSQKEELEGMKRQDVNLGPAAEASVTTVTFGETKNPVQIGNKFTALQELKTSDIGPSL